VGQQPPPWPVAGNGATRYEVCWEGSDLIFKKTVDVWTLKALQGRLISEI
jgi:hypothetical protein